MRGRKIFRFLAVYPYVCLALCIATVGVLLTAAAARAAEPVIPNFVDPGRYVVKPDFDRIQQIRFLTELDAPPFSYIGPDGELTGFNVDLAREICRVLDLPCTIQGFKWELLVSGIEAGRGDAIIAQIAITEESRRRFLFTDRYLARPGRFVGTDRVTIPEATPTALGGKAVAVVQGSAHEAFLRNVFPGSAAMPYADITAALKALRDGNADLVFGDALSLSLWLNGKASDGCCHFVGGPFTESRYFGEGLAIAVAPENAALADALNHALARVGASNEFLEIYLRYFPISFY
ncbi:MAG: transporter substrate-binding domain-containing protein [Flavobacteriaceae bacterium]